MATTRFVFTPTAAEFPSANFPALAVDGQSRPYLAFDTTTDETCYWTFLAPQGLSGALTCVITYRAASATSGTACFEVALEAISDGDATDTDAGSSFATVNTASAATVPGTAGYIDQFSVTLTNNDSIAAGDYVRLRVNRDVSADNASGDIQVLAVELREA